MSAPRRSPVVAVTLGALALLLGCAGVLVSHLRTARAAAPITAPASAAASSDRARVAPTAVPKDDRLDRAAALHARAESLQAAGRAREAAALHIASAALRPTDDSSSTTCLEAAGILLTDTGDFGDARAAMRAAVAHAMARGDVAHAADLTLLAGFIAREQGDTAGVVAHAREARWLANAPSVTRVQRAAILSRIRVAASETAGDTQ